MDLRKSLSVLLLVLVCSVAVQAAPIPIEEIGSRIHGKNFSPLFYSKHPGTQVLVEFGIASWYDCPTKPEKVQNPSFKLKDHIYPVAHKTLPFGTLIKAINPVNGKKILCRVVDRGPFIAGRIIDFDRHAAQAIGISGIGKIILKIYKVDADEYAAAKSKSRIN